MNSLKTLLCSALVVSALSAPVQAAPTIPTKQQIQTAIYGAVIALTCTIYLVVYGKKCNL